MPFCQACAVGFDRSPERASEATSCCLSDERRLTNKKPANQRWLGRGQVPDNNGLTVSRMRILPNRPRAGKAASRSAMPKRPSQAPFRATSMRGDLGQVPDRWTCSLERIHPLRARQITAIARSQRHSEQFQRRLAITVAVIKGTRINVKQRMMQRHNYFDFFECVLCAGASKSMLRGSWPLRRHSSM